MPNYTVKDNVVRLECHYDMEDEKLYSVKWYKDGNEFYRYLPRDHPPASLFPLTGIFVDVSENFSLSFFILIKFIQIFRLALQFVRHTSCTGKSPTVIDWSISMRSFG